MNKPAVRNIIESTLKSGDKTPGLFDIPKILKLKSSLESCASVEEVIALLEGNRNLITKAFGLDDKVIANGIAAIKDLS
ncbi:hypothetical protein [Methyloradius palustris]|uniref:Uncharacterized protein n=1 Tax=Methyloradius palustris TaxID=2778876 RepID=A0A8D5JL82_9PROT|nr:hypothetical protein [Methyloradius palustris]BCM24625.1 hypothetical protein ZMTM_08840 [Methyloradius palustris]